MKKIIRYQAYDGKEFETIKDCEFYETKLHTTKPQDFIKMFDSIGVEIKFDSILKIGVYTAIPRYIYVKEWNKEVESFLELLKDLSEYMTIPRNKGLWMYDRLDNRWYPMMERDRKKAEGAISIYKQFNENINMETGYGI